MYILDVYLYLFEEGLFEAAPTLLRFTIRVCLVSRKGAEVDPLPCS